MDGGNERYRLRPRISGASPLLTDRTVFDDRRYQNSAVACERGGDC